MLSTIEAMWSPYWGQIPLSKPSSWKLSALEMPNDIQISERDAVTEVTIAAQSFRYASEVPAILDGERGKFFSRRLSKAMIRFITQNGRDAYTLNTILRQRFNIRLWDESVYPLTSRTTKEQDARFQRFSNEEKLTLLTALAEVPDGIKLRNSQINLLRRKDTVPHPLLNYRKALFVGWSSPSESLNLIPPYIEVMQEAFNLDERARLETLIASISGILWDREIPSALKMEWIKIGTWRNLGSGEWVTDNPTEAHSEIGVGLYNGPKADFAASVATYISNGEELKVRSPTRYDFLRLYVMHGSRYIRELRKDLSFPVLNLWPDYSGPSGIREASAVIRGNAADDKFLSVNLSLYGTDLRTNGALRGNLLLVRRGSSGDSISDISIDCTAHNPDPVYKVSLELKCYKYISKYVEGGYYDIHRIYLYDQVENYWVANQAKFPWSLYVKNYLQQPPPPRIVADSQSISLEQSIVKGQEVPLLKTQFRVDQSTAPFGARSFISSECVTGCTRSRYEATDRATIRGELVTIPTLLSPFIPSGMYGLNEIYIFWENKLLSSMFSSVPNEGEYQRPFVTLHNDDEDTVSPEIDLNQIRVAAQPTYPEAPDGRTQVKVTLRARDNKSGLAYLGACLRSPRGLTSCTWIDDESFKGVIETGATTEWRDYSTTISLPAGSAPGIWGVERVFSGDKVGWILNHNLTELVEFRVESQVNR
jgi:hypothetical protein